MMVAFRKYLVKDFLNSVPFERSAAQVTTDRERVTVLSFTLPCTIPLNWSPLAPHIPGVFYHKTLTRLASKAFIHIVVYMIPNIFFF